MKDGEGHIPTNNHSNILVDNVTIKGRGILHCAKNVHKKPITYFLYQFKQYNSIQYTL